MAGHSQFKNIMHRKGAQDKKRAKIFSKASKEIIVAVKQGGVDQDSNPRLRTAIAAARSVNMPKDNIERAIKKAAGGDDDTNYTEVRYEGYGPAGVAFIVSGLTDNKNRMASEIRSTFSKYGGSLGEANSVIFQFSHVGEIVYDATNISNDEILEIALDVGAQDVETEETTHTVTVKFEDFNTIREALLEKFGDPQRAEAIWKPSNTISIDEKHATTLIKLINTLEENDDVQGVYANFEMDQSIFDSLAIE